VAPPSMADMALWDEAFEAAATRQAQRFLDRLDDAVHAAGEGDGEPSPSGAPAATTAAGGSERQVERPVAADELAAALGGAGDWEARGGDSGSVDSEYRSNYDRGSGGGDSNDGDSDTESPAILAELAEWGQDRVHLRVRGTAASLPDASGQTSVSSEPDEVLAQHGQLAPWLCPDEATAAPQQQPVDNQRAARREAVMASLFDALWQELQEPAVAHILPLLQRSSAQQQQQQRQQQQEEEQGYEDYDSSSAQEFGGAEVMRFSSSDSSRGSDSGSGMFRDANEDADEPEAHWQAVSVGGSGGDAAASDGDRQSGIQPPTASAAASPLPPLESQRQWRHPSPGGSIGSAMDGRALSAPMLNTTAEGGGGGGQRRGEGGGGGLLGRGGPDLEFELHGRGGSRDGAGAILEPDFGVPEGGVLRDASSRSAGGWGQRPGSSTRSRPRPLSGGALLGGGGGRGRSEAGQEHSDGGGVPEWSFLPPIVGRGVGRR
jgi:hypothetical protein